MDHKIIITICKALDCCDVCCLRYIGLKIPSAFEAANEYISKILERHPESDTNTPDGETGESATPQPECDDFVPAKKTKMSDAVCPSCLGVLQDDSRRDCLAAVAALLEDRRYECREFACALSAPVATVLRERAVAAALAERLPHYDAGAVTSLKEAWKWARGAELARRCGMALGAGGAAPLLVTLRLRYEGEARELAALGARGPPTRRGALEAAERAEPAALRAAAAALTARAELAGVDAERRPLVLAGRYVKLSRELPQTPWLVEGRRALPSSVQDVIFEPLAELLGLSAAEAERRLKFTSAGREDVDVRCLGAGRPFAVEVWDPRRDPAPEELAAACRRISASGTVRVASLVPVPRERLAELKRGEESKCKTYEALCIKLAHTAEDAAEGGGEVRVTERDLRNVERWGEGEEEGEGEGGAVLQRTPLRVLHRRALLARARRVRCVRAARVAGHGALLALRLRTPAGTYVKEWAHGELRRTRPALAAALRAPADILALDVTAVELEWP